MKVYFTASLSGKKKFLKNYREIHKILKELGCQVFSGHVFSSTKEEVISEAEKEMEEYRRLTERKISWCDTVIAEVSYPSTSVGFEILLGIRKNKPVVVLYDENCGDFPTLLKAFEKEEVVLLGYCLEHLRSTLKDCLEYLRTQSLDKRFTVLLPPKIVDHLDRVFEESGISRSEYIRDLIVKDMKVRGK